MIIPTCFEDLDWSENAKPTSSHFLAIIMALRERITFAEPSSLPTFGKYWAGELGSNYDYNAISQTEMREWFASINYMVSWVGEIAEQALEKSDYDGTESIASIEKLLFWMPTDTELPVESELTKKLKTPQKWLIAHEQALASKIDSAPMGHRYKEIDFKAIMRTLNQYKNAIGGLTEVYAPLGTLAVNRPQYYIDWTRERAGESRPSFTAIQERRDGVEEFYNIGAFWSQFTSDPPDAWDWERLGYYSNDCDIPYIFKYPAEVSVNCWESTDSYEDEPTEWYYDFGTGLNKGWNKLGTYNLGERIPLLPKKGWGDEKATAVPPKRGAIGFFLCEWGIDYIKFDFRDSLKFKVLPSDA